MILGLGGNLGPVRERLAWAIAELRRLLGPFEVAPLYRSAAIGPGRQPDYLNTVVLARAVPPDSRRGVLGPEEILALAKALELAAGRRRGIRFGPRPLDVDLLVCGSLTRDRPELTLPHPRLRERRFVLAPLADLAPELALPSDGARVGELLAALGPEQELERIDWGEKP